MRVVHSFGREDQLDRAAVQRLAGSLGRLLGQEPAGAAPELAYAGSVAFGVSAVAAYINPVTGQVHNAGRASTQTLIGAVCFFIGALLLMPERTEELPTPVAPPA